MKPGAAACSAVCATVLAFVAGCSGGSGGTGPPQAPGAQTSTPQGTQEEYANLLRECLVVPKPTIAQITGVAGLLETFSGAVCRWKSVDGGTTVQLNWFETGTMRTEKDVAERLGYAVENVRMGGVVSYVLHPPDDPSSCGAVGRAGGAGVIGWWVHSSPADPCEAAKQLLERSVNRTL